MQHFTVTSGNAAKGTAVTLPENRYSALFLRNRSGVTITVCFNDTILGNGFDLPSGEDLNLTGKTMGRITEIATSSTGGSHDLEVWAS